MGDLSPAAQSAIAFEIGKAALLGEKVFNFGELLVRRPPHPRMTPVCPRRLGVADVKAALSPTFAAAGAPDHGVAGGHTAGVDVHDAHGVQRRRCRRLPRDSSGE
jgi:hypothetical protein